MQRTRGAMVFAVAVFGYALLGWLPVIFMEPVPTRFGMRGWPFLSFPISLVASLIAAGAVWLLLRRGAHWLWDVVAAIVIVAATGAAMGLYFSWVDYYAPLTDRATAIEIGWSQLANGRNPYEAVTQLGNPLAPMVGGMLLAAPVIMLAGDLSWYGPLTILCVIALFVAARGIRVAAAVVFLLLFSPAIRLELISQSDSWINAVWICATVLIADRVLAARPSQAIQGAALLLGVILGCALAYRYTYAPAALPVLVVFVRTHGWRRVLPMACVTAVTSIGLAVVPWLVNPSLYGPLQIMDHAPSERFSFFRPLLAALMLVVFVVGSMLARTLSQAYLVTTVALSVMVGLLMLAYGALASYESVAYNGALLVFLLFAAAVRYPARSSSPPVSERVRDGQLRAAAMAQPAASTRDGL